jgi:hypothetical protein
MTAAPPPVHLVGPPVAMLVETSSGPAFQVRVRLDRRPPADRQGARVNVLVRTSGSDDAPAPFGLRSRRCYAASVGNDVRGGDPALRDVAPGDRVRVTVEIAGQRRIVRTVTLRSRTGARTAFAALGCGRQR